MVSAKLCFALFLAGVALAPAGRADVGILLHESTGVGWSQYTSAGHAAVYLSNICMDNPVRLRLCVDGEGGSVISNYSDFKETSPYEWNISPLSVYLYGVEDLANVPLYGDLELRRVLQEAWRRKHLESICPASCGETQGRWRDMVGAAFMRDLYLFRLKTTVEQDNEIIETYNREANSGRYNGLTYNCADFARNLINRYFPGAAKADHLNDFGMTSPKAISKSFTRFGEEHPDLMFTADRVSQLPGPIRRSEDCRKGMEASFHIKKWLIPLAYFRTYELPVFMAAYLLTGRFNPEHVYRKYAKPVQQGQDTVFGTEQEWARYRAEFRLMVQRAQETGVFRDQSALNRFFKTLAENSQSGVDANGKPELRAGSATVGLTRATILAPSSDRTLAYQLMLARIQAMLKARPKDREKLSDFQADWGILKQLAGEETIAAGAGGAQ